MRVFPVQRLSYSGTVSTTRETRWLDADEQRTWAQLSTMILRLQPLLSAELEREFGISHFEDLIMARLSEVPESKLRMSVPGTPTTATSPSCPRRHRAGVRLRSIDA